MKLKLLSKYTGIIFLIVALFSVSLACGKSKHGFGGAGGMQLSENSVSEEQQESLQKSMKAKYGEVESVKVDQSYSRFVLAVYVDPDTSEAVAMIIGDDFVRKVKQIADDPPGEEIGPGQFEYRIGVFRAGGFSTIATGRKSLEETSVNWGREGARQDYTGE